MHRHPLILVAISLGLIAYTFARAQQPSPPDGSGFDVRQAGAIGDGKADDTAAIQSVVNSGRGVLLFPAGRYRLTKTIRIELDKVGPTSIAAEGPVTILMEGPGPAFHFVGTHEGTAAPHTVKSNVWERQRTPMVDGIELLGRHSKASGIEATKTMQLTITRVSVRDALHGIHLTDRNRNVIISQCHLYDNHGVGIFYDNVNLHQSNITNCHVSYNDAGGVVIRGGDVRNVHIGTCDIEGNMGDEGPPTANVLLDSTGGSIGEVAITGCTIQHAHEAAGSANIRINGLSTARSFTEERRHGNITIADNVLSDTQVNVDVANTRGVTITGNTIWKGYAANLSVTGSEHVAISNNVFDRNPRYHYGDGGAADHGIRIANCSTIGFAGNLVATATVAFEDCRHVNVANCTLSGGDGPALKLVSVDDSRVSDCLIYRSEPAERPALSIRGGRGSMLVDNRIVGHTVASDSNWIIRDNLESATSD